MHRLQKHYCRFFVLALAMVKPLSCQIRLWAACLGLGKGGRTT